MTAITFDANTTWNKRGKPPVVRIDAGRQGRLVFSVEAVKILGLKEGMRLCFRVYTNDEGIIYFYEQATGIPLRVMNEHKSGHQLAIYCRQLNKTLLAHFGYTTSIYKTFDLKNEQVLMPDTNCKAWFIVKENIHKPIQWKAKTK
jgi:hypothetical protein